MRDEELILRFFAFHVKKLKSYRTPLKHWLNDIAQDGRRYSDVEVQKLGTAWRSTINNCLKIFSPEECFRRLPLTTKVVNRALMDRTMQSLSEVNGQTAQRIRRQFRRRYMDILKNDEFEDLTRKSVDHKSRTKWRFGMWKAHVTSGLL